jgi:hypothetical protein
MIRFINEVGIGHFALLAFSIYALFRIFGAKSVVTENSPIFALAVSAVLIPGALWLFGLRLTQQECRSSGCPIHYFFLDAIVVVSFLLQVWWICRKGKLKLGELVRGTEIPGLRAGLSLIVIIAFSYFAISSRAKMFSRDCSLSDCQLIDFVFGSELSRLTGSSAITLFATLSAIALLVEVEKFRR